MMTDSLHWNTFLVVVLVSRHLLIAEWGGMILQLLINAS